MALRGAQRMYNNKLNSDISSSKVSSSAAPINSSSPVGEKRRKTLDQNHLYQPELNPNLQIIQKPPDTDPRDTADHRSPRQQSTTNASQPPLPPAAGDPTTTTTATTPLIVRYRECLKNHAASMGGHVVDGCGEFMPSGGGGPEALKCAACECHRNFHRKEINGETQYAPPSCYYTNNNINPNNNIRRETTVHPPPPLHQQRSFILPTAPVMMNFRGGGGSRGGAVESSSEDLNVLQYSNYAGGRGGGPESSSSKKRFRTRFSEEQKEKMMEFAEKLGWRIQKEDEVQVQQFCCQVGVKRKVFKVWMHNNRQAMKKKQM